MDLLFVKYLDIYLDKKNEMHIMVLVLVLKRKKIIVTYRYKVFIGIHPDQKKLLLKMYDIVMENYHCNEHHSCHNICNYI